MIMHKQIYNQKRRFKLEVSRWLGFVLVSLVSVQALAQSKTVTGTITDSSGEGLPGATVLIEGTATGTTTDVNGGFTLEADESDILVFSYVGFQTQSISVAGRTTFNIALEEGSVLDEVVVIGYGASQKKDVTGSVANIDAKDFNPGLISTPDQLFSGKIAGIQVTPTGGQPGAAAVIAIRGIGTLSGNTQPLYVVDGLLLDDINPLPNAITFDPLGQSPQRSPLTFINPNDIASMTVLKDASATAIYGSRASNGVVVITTKSAKTTGSFLDFNSSVSFSSMRGDYGVLSASEYNAIEGTTDFGGNTNWVDQVVRDAVSTGTYLSFGNLNETGDYTFSMGYDNQEGIMFGSRMERITARLNANQEVIEDFLTANINLQVTQLDDDISPAGASVQASGNLITGVISMNPTIPLRNPDGTFTQRGDDVGGTVLSEDFNNPKAILDNYSDNARTRRILGNTSLKAQFTDNLSGTIRLGLDRSVSNRGTSLNENYVGRAGSQNLNGIAIVSQLELQNTLFEGILNYNKEIGDGNLKVLLGYSWQEFQSFGSFLAGTNPNTDDNFIEQFGVGAMSALAPVSPNAISGAPSTAVGGALYSLQAYFARVNYDIGGKYLFTGTVRRDGSSKFGENNKYGTFPSLAVGWIISDESFIPSTFDLLKLRAGWGITGSQTAPPSAGKTVTTFQQAGTAFQLIQAQQGNPDLKWEESTQLNIGVDFGFVDNRVRGSLDYFDKTTQDLIVPIAGVAGLRYENLDAELKNAGIEFLLEGDIIKTTDFSFRAAFNYTLYTQSEVTKYGGAFPINYGFVAAPGIQGGGSPTQRIQEGVALGQWFLPRFGGYDAENDVFITDPQQIIEGADAIPDYNFGITLGADYKGFDFSINFTGAGGHQVLNVTSNSYLQRNRVVLQNIYNTTQDQIDKYPGVIAQAPPAQSSQALEDGDFVRLNNLNLGYTFNTGSLNWIKTLRLSVSGQNLALWSKYSGLDPEVNAGSVGGNGIQVQGIDNGTFPRASVLTFGVNASF